MLRSWMAAVSVALAIASQAQAHFIWLDIKPVGGGQQAQLFFGEEPEPGAAKLIGKVAHSKLWLRGADGATKELSTRQTTHEDTATLVADCAVADAGSLECSCDYGVYQRGNGILLQYYAKRLTGDWAKSSGLARAEKLKLDVVPSVANGKLDVQVLYAGKPVADSVVIFVDPSGEHHELKTDAQGHSGLKVGGGRWAVRAAQVEADKSGERDGKKYGETWHQATLVLDVPGAPATAAAETAADAEALKTLERARAGRAIWEEFPGFTTNLVVRSGGQEVTGKATVKPDGSVDLSMPKSPVTEWVDQQLASLVQHRMPDGEVAQGNVTFVAEESVNPLGRKIDLGDPEAGSAYRIKDDVILEVNRNMGPLRFTISVMEIERNAEQKYLPRSFTMNFFDRSSGDLRTSLAYYNAWQRVGAFDLPKTILEIDAHKGGATTKVIEFSDLKLLEK